MFWKKRETQEQPEAAVKLESKASKLPGPRSIEEIVGRHLVVESHQNPDWVWNLRSVVRQRSDGKHRFDVRVFDGNQVAAKKVSIKDYTSLDQHPELILYEGWFDKVSMQVEINGKKPA